MEKVLVLKNAYFDSAFLMLVSKAVKQLPGIRDAALVMGTEVNIEILRGIGLLGPVAQSVSPNDLIIAIQGQSAKTLNHAMDAAKKLLRQRKTGIEEEGEYRPVSLQGALRIIPDANLVVISAPGLYAAREARKALDAGLHVMLFSDHVSLEEEIALKKKAVRKDLLMMGPDCGTALINGKPLCFANVVRRGNIGVVAASGSGLQELTCLIHHFGGGLSQAIGTGGRDLRREVGGLMMLTGIEALTQDPSTKVIVVLSKPPDGQVADKVHARLKQTGKPCVIHFVGLKAVPASGDAHFAGDLEETAAMAVALSKGKRYRRPKRSSPETDPIVKQETRDLGAGQKYLRGLYAGGTLAEEALVLFEREGYDIYSNIRMNPEKTLKDPHRSFRHTIVDLGEDRFTAGRPHPMIDPDIRAQRIEKETAGPEVACLLLDFVLGYGAHEDPCGALLKTLKEAKDRAEKRGGHLAVVASITGTEDDPQNKREQSKKLESIGCVVMPSNAQAARLALQIMREVTP
jgi:succinyl-CoA synthetase alpha subunit